MEELNDGFALSPDRRAIADRYVDFSRLAAPTARPGSTEFRNA
jgi:hypothetical protein